MPTYQYACTVCGHQLEAVQSFSDAPLTVCPECEGRLRKVFSSVGIVFKGSGFYRTDSRSGASSAEGAGTGATSEATSAKSDGGSSTTSSGGTSSSGSTSSSSTGSSSGSGSTSSGGSTKPAAVSS